MSMIVLPLTHGHMGHGQACMPCSCTQTRHMMAQDAQQHREPLEQGLPCRELVTKSGRTAVRYMLRSAAYLAMRLAAAAASTASSSAFAAACAMGVEW